MSSTWCDPSSFSYKQSMQFVIQLSHMPSILSPSVSFFQLTVTVQYIQIEVQHLVLLIVILLQAELAFKYRASLFEHCEPTTLGIFATICLDLDAERFRACRRLACPTKCG